jgi:beta-lactamase regulating signal transducer with metallopeptidase domain
MGYLAAVALSSAANGVAAGLVLTALVWAGLRCCVRLNASTRYAVWLGALAAVCLQVMAGPSPVMPKAAGAAFAGAAGFSGRMPQFVLPEGSWAMWVAGMWLAGATLMLARVAWSYRAIRRIKNGAKPLGPAWQERFAHVLSAHPGTRQPALCASPEVRVPIAAGLLQPMIVMPEGLPERLSPAEFDQIVLHELAHIRRRDDWTKLLQRVFEAVFFFHPGVRSIGRRLDLEREIACDDWVVEATGLARPYAACLAKLAGWNLFARRAQLAPGALARKSETRQRVEALLENRRPASPRFSRVSVAGAAAGIVLASGAALQFAPVAVAGASLPALSMPAPVVAGAMAYAPHPRPPAAAPERRLVARRAPVLGEIPEAQAVPVGNLQPAQQVQYLLILDSGDHSAGFRIFYSVTIFFEPPPPPAVHKLA